MTTQPTIEELLARTVKLARYVVNHGNAGHDHTNPKFVTDLRTLRRNADRVLDLIPPYPASTEDRLGFIVRELVHQRITHKESIVSLATDISAAARETGSSAIAAGDRAVAAVAAATSEISARLDAAIARIAELIAAGSADEAALQEALADIQAADAAVDSIAPAPAEPTPEESSARRPPPPSPSVP